MQIIIDKLKQALMMYFVNQVLTKENITRWVSEGLDKALVNAQKSPAEWDNPIVKRIHDIWTEINKAG